jgi:dihydroflavonol-4-reductase
LRIQLGAKANKAKTRSMPDWVVRALAVFVRDLRNVTPVLGEVKECSNEKAKQVLGWSPRPKEEIILATAESLFATGSVQ